MRSKAFSKPKAKEFFSINQKNECVSSHADATYVALAFYFVLHNCFISLVLRDTEGLFITADHVRLHFCAITTAVLI